LEIAFLFLGVALGKIGSPPHRHGSIFLAILVVGFIYEWKKERSMGLAIEDPEGFAQMATFLPLSACRLRAGAMVRPNLGRILRQAQDDVSLPSNLTSS